MNKFNKISNKIYKIFFVYLAATLAIAIPINIFKPDNIKPIILIELLKVFFIGFLFMLLVTLITMMINFIIFISQIKKVGFFGKIGIGIGIGIILAIGLLIYFNIFLFISFVFNSGILAYLIYLYIKYKRSISDTYAIVLYFDNDSTVEINKTISEIAKNSKNNYMLKNLITPHITIASFYSFEIENMKNFMLEFLENTKKSQITLSKIDTFYPKVIYISPEKNEYLLELNRKINSLMEEHFEAADDDNYLPEKWIPHCALAVKMDEAQIEKGLDATESMELPITISVEKIALVKCNPYREIEVWDI